MSRQIFKDLMARVGDQHRYQFILLAIGCVLLLEAASTSFVNAFLFYQDDYICPDSTTNCQQYVCSLPSDEQQAYINPNFNSMVSRFGNYRCEIGGQTDWVQGFIYLGGIVGVIASIIFLTCFTHRQVLVVTYLFNIVGLALTLLSPSLLVAGVGLFLNFMGRGVQSGLITSFISQSLAADKRAEYILWGYMGYAIAAPMVALVYWVIHPWELAMGLYQLIPYLVLLVTTLLLIEESPFDLVTTSSPEQSLAAFQRIARINGVECDIREQELAAIKQEYDQNERQKHDFKVSFTDIFRYSSLRGLTILAFLVRFLISYQFFAPQLVLKDYSLNIYLNGIVIGLSQIIAVLICLKIQKILDRKKTLIITEVAGLIFTLLVVLFAPCSGESECSSFQVVLQTVCLFIFRLLVTIAYDFYLVQLTEIYPSQIKAIGMQLNAIANTSSYVVIPFVQSLFERAHVSIVISFCVVSGLICLLILPLPQTLGTTPPQMIQQLAYQRAEERQK